MGSNFLSHYNSSTTTTETKAKNLRHPQTPAEKRFWHYVRDRKMLGLKFRREHPVGKYVVDFYCHKLKLVIEIDGSIHDLKSVKKRDLIRESYLEELGLKILRFSNEDVFNNAHLIEKEINNFITTAKGTSSVRDAATFSCKEKDN